MQSYVLKGGKGLLIGGSQIQPFLGIVQKLVSSKVNDVHGLDLLFSIFDTLDMYVLFYIGILIYIQERHEAIYPNDTDSVD
jgi:hypothetical protein